MSMDDLYKFAEISYDEVSEHLLQSPNIDYPDAAYYLYYNSAAQMDARHFPKSRRFRLSHYTSLSAAIEIIRSNRLRLYDTEYMNDSQDRRYADEMVRTLIDELTPHTDQEGPKSHIFRLSRIMLEDHLNKNDLYQHKYFAFCTTRAEDLPSQWLNYSGPTGVEIIFDGKRLTDGFDFPDLPSMEAPVIYNPQRQKSLIFKTLFAFAMHSINVMVGKDNLDEIWGDCSFYSHTWLSHALSRIKNPCFKEENEARLIARSSLGNFSNAQFEARGGYARSYLEYHWGLHCPGGRLPIQELRLAPGLEAQSRVQSMNEFLRYIGRSDIKVSVSNVPLRTFNQLY